MCIITFKQTRCPECKRRQFYSTRKHCTASTKSQCRILRTHRLAERSNICQQCFSHMTKLQASEDLTSFFMAVLDAEPAPSYEAENTNELPPYEAITDHPPRYTEMNMSKQWELPRHHRQPKGFFKTLGQLLCILPLEEDDWRA